MKASLLTLGVLLLWPAGAFAARPNYVQCPGVNLSLLCGELKFVPKARGIQVFCGGEGDTNLRKKAQRISEWANKIERAVDEQREVAQALGRLSLTYGNYPQKKEYLAGLGGVIQNSLLDRYMEPLLAEMKEAQQCIWDEKYKSGGCRYISSETCLDEPGMIQRIRFISPRIKEVENSLRNNRSMLLEGLPSGMYQQAACSADRPPCRQNMNAAVNALINAQELIERNLFDVLRGLER